MALYVVRHQHAAETCPARDPEMGAMLLNHLSPENARQQGVTIQSEAVLDGEHTLYLIAQAEDRAQLEAFMQPFGHVGNVEIWPASHCEAVISLGGCEAVTL